MDAISRHKQRDRTPPIANWFASAATIFLGALPATLLVGFMFLGGVFGVAGLLSGEALAGAAMLTCSLFGVVGTYGLWAAAWPTRRISTAIELAIGLVGLIGANVLVWPPSGFAGVTWLKVWLLWMPGVVGAYHLVRIVSAATRERRAQMD
jgi:hypothetical protein